MLLARILTDLLAHLALLKWFDLLLSTPALRVAYLINGLIRLVHLTSVRDASPTVIVATTVRLARVASLVSSQALTRHPVIENALISTIKILF